MSVILIDGCDIYNNTTNLMRRWDTSIELQYLTISQTAGRFGGGALTFPDRTAYIGKYVQEQTLYTGMSIQRRTDSVNDPTVSELPIIAYKNNVGTDHLSLRYFTVGGRLRVYLGPVSDGIILAEAFGTIDTTYRFLEFGAHISDDPEEGWVEVRLNGDSAPIIRYDGATRGGTSTNDTITEVRLQGGLYVNEGGLFRYIRMNFDDIYIISGDATAPNGFIGDCKVVTDVPTGDDASTGYTVEGAATAYEAVDDGITPDDDTTRIVGTEVGHQATFTFPALEEAPDAIYGVALTHLTRKTDAGTGYVAGVATDGVDTTIGPATSVASTYGFEQSFMPNAPDGTAWDKSKVDSAAIGVRIVSAA